MARTVKITVGAFKRLLKEIKLREVRRSAVDQYEDMVNGLGGMDADMYEDMANGLGTELSHYNDIGTDRDTYYDILDLDVDPDSVAVENEDDEF